MTRRAAGANELDRALTLALDRALALDLDRISARDLALARTLARDLACTLDLDRVRALDRARALVSALDSAQQCAPSRVDAVVARGAGSTPGWVSWRLIALAVRLLPVAQRPRYRGEFGVELVELPRQKRWGYALRVLASAWELRKALIEAVRTSNGEPARRAER